MQLFNCPSLSDQFFAPADEALKQTAHRRVCHTLPDDQWLRMGVERVLGDFRSGREFLQQWNLQRNSGIGVVHFFDTIASARRLRLVRDVNTRVASAMPSHAHSGLDAFGDLEKFDVYGGDGHYIQASAHDQPVQGRKRPCGHFYTLNMRTRALTHLCVSDLQGGMKKGEHDMSALKRLGGKALRQGAPSGRKVLYVWDPAGINIGMWGHWKQNHGVYFLSRVTANMGFIAERENQWDRADPVNRGVVSDTIGTTLGGAVRLRLIVYRCPDSGREFEFVTTEMTIRPGLLGWLYKCRWDLEKTYDTFKNKFGQTKAWGGTAEAKTMQAQLVCLAHNLMVLLQAALDLEDEKETRRAAVRMKEKQERALRSGSGFAPQYLNTRKRSQLASKFIRWLRHCLRGDPPVEDALGALRAVYAAF